MTPPPTFSPAALAFLRGLKRHNDRAWFAAHKEAYERDVKAPMVALVERLAADLRRFAPDLVASPNASLYRLHRDTRFSADKSPFKTQVGAVFPHRALHRHQGAGLYLENRPGRDDDRRRHLHAARRPNCTRSGATWPRTPRGSGRSSSRPAFRRAVGPVSARRSSGLPRGFPPDHPAAEYLKLKQFLFGRDYPAAFATSPRVLPAGCRFVRTHGTGGRVS